MKRIESLLKIANIKFEFENFEIRFHKRQVSFLVVKTSGPETRMRCPLQQLLAVAILILLGNRKKDFVCLHIKHTSTKIYRGLMVELFNFIMILYSRKPIFYATQNFF